MAPTASHAIRLLLACEAEMSWSSQEEMSGHLPQPTEYLVHSGEG